MLNKIGNNSFIPYSHSLTLTPNSNPNPNSNSNPSKWILRTLKTDSKGYNSDKDVFSQHVSFTIYVNVM